MTPQQFDCITRICRSMRTYADSLMIHAEWLCESQMALRRDRGYGEDPVETPVVYNLSLDEIAITDKPLFILAADNPGIQEQKAHQRRYLVGQSGKLADSWFRVHLNADFREATLIINKTPIHTPKTAELRLLPRYAGPHAAALKALIEESQRVMARYACSMLECLEIPLWISGLGELGPRGIFRPYAEELMKWAEHAPKPLRDRIWLFRHFSMNQFAIEYRQYSQTHIAAEESPAAVLANLEAIGCANRRRILGF
ncbi:MAG: hypothetical protein N3A02_08775 [Rectinema sp.]|nr:hypothetical protein [Rectinema sp.]